MTAALLVVLFVGVGLLAVVPAALLARLTTSGRGRGGAPTGTSSTT